MSGAITERRAEGAEDVLRAVISTPIHTVQRLLPNSGTPVFLGLSALAVAGFVDLPAAAAMGLGYLAIKRWAP